MKRRGFATFLVLWVIVIAAVVLTAVEASSFRQAAQGRDALARTRAYWAARAGLEATIARLEHGTESGDASDPYLILDDMAAVATGALAGVEYRVAWSGRNGDILGPADAHAKLNVNALSTDSLMLLTFMTEDVADAIQDWVDVDEDVRPFGAEFGQYQTLPFPYLPRNAPMRSLLELELILGVPPEYVRGEDWNLNGMLDPNEDDGDDSWPPDNRDGVLEGEWSSILTTASRDGGLGASGQARVDLSVADASELTQRINVDATQADVIINYVSLAANASLADFIRTNLNQLRNPSTNQVLNQSAIPLSRDQLAALLNETTIGSEAAGPRPGKLNINTCEPEVLEYLPQIDALLADAIIAERSARTFGFASVVDLLDVPGMTRGRLAQMYALLDVRSNVFIATIRGRDSRTGIEVEIVATVDRSTLPVTIREVLIR